MHYFAYIVGGWVEKKGKLCLRNKSMAPKVTIARQGRELATLSTTRLEFQCDHLAPRIRKEQHEI